MHNNFEVLESKCKKYHLKRILKMVLPVGLIFLIIIISLFSFSSNKEELVKKDNLSTLNNASTFKNISEKKLLKSTVFVKKEEPDIFQQLPVKREDVEYDLHLYSYNLLNKKREKVIRKIAVQKNVIAKKQKISRVTEINKVSSVQAQQQTNIKAKNNSFSIVLKNLNSTDKMIEIYNKEQTYPIALKIAKLFYKQKNFKRALLWSKKANTIDARAEEAWLIYAKSEYALGHIKRAKGILKVYVNNSNSKEAKSLLISWIKGDR